MYQYIKIISMCVSVCLCVSNGSQVLDYTSDAYDFHTYVTLISRYSNDNASPEMLSLSQCNQLRWTHVDTVRMRVHKTAEERTVTCCVNVQEFVLGAVHAMTDSRVNAIEEQQLKQVKLLLQCY